jgi:hypothetical protein
LSLYNGSPAFAEHDVRRDQEGRAIMTKLLEIQIAPDDLEFLKTNQYLLCFAKIPQSYNTAIIWQCFSDYLQNNPLSWPLQYEVFGSSSFITGGVATIDTNTATIALGRQITLTADAVFQSQAAGAPANSFTIHNEYRQKIYLGFGGWSTGPDGVPRMTPIFVMPTPASDFDTFTPVEIVKVWFQQNVVTGTIVDSTSISNAIDIDVRTRDFGKLLYQGGKWSEQTGGWSNTL